MAPTRSTDAARSGAVQAQSPPMPNAPEAAPRPDRELQVAEQVDRPSIFGAAVAELIGTFILLFFGIGTILAVGGAGGAGEKLAIALAFGLAILACAYALGHVSGAHLNPAVTLGLVATRRFPVAATGPYILAQLAGGTLGALAVQAVFASGDVASSVTRPGEGVNAGGALLAEALLGFILMLVVKATAVDDRAEGPAAGMAIGLTITAGHLAMIPVSGASFNPARSFASALVGGDFGDFWIYLVGPTAGAILAAVLYESLLRRTRPPDVDDQPG